MNTNHAQAKYIRHASERILRSDSSLNQSRALTSGGNSKERNESTKSRRVEIVEDCIALLLRLLFVELIEAAIACSNGTFKISTARLYVLYRKCLLKLQEVWRFYHDCSHAADQVKINVAMEEPYSWIISSKAKKEPAKWRNYDIVAPSRSFVEQPLIPVPAAHSSTCDLEVMSLS